jgi:hypothetical protein
MTSRTARRAAGLAALAGELRRLIREAATLPQRELFTERAHPSTREARDSGLTVTMSAREASELLSAALPTSGRDTTTRQRHAMLLIALRHCLDTVRDLSADTATPAAVRAAELAGRELRTWLRMVEAPKVKRSTARPVPAQGRLLLPIAGKPATRGTRPLNIIAVLPQEAAVNHSAIPFRSDPAPTTKPDETGFTQSTPERNDLKPSKRTARK